MSRQQPELGDRIVTDLQIVKFEGDELETVRDERGVVWVSTRRMCESLGVDFASQTVKLRTKPWAVVAMITTTGPDGKSYQMHSLHLDSVPMWLATIDEGRVAEDVRPKLQRYQLECARVLRDHFFGAPRAARPSDDLAFERERRLMAREVRLGAKLVADVVDRMETLAPRARDALRARALEPQLGDIRGALPVVEERWLTITEIGSLYGVSANLVGRVRKDVGVNGNVAGICELRLSKAAGHDKQVEQQFVTPVGVAMIGRGLLAKCHAPRPLHESVCRGLGVDPYEAASA